MTVEELIDALADLPADATVSVMLGESYSEDGAEITVTLADPDWVVLRTK